jgi:hypothetical protein
MENIVGSLLKKAKMVMVIIIIISMLFSFPLQAAIAQYATGNPPITTIQPPYSNLPPSSSYPYTQAPQQQQPLMPAVPTSPSSPQFMPPSAPSNPSQTPQQILPPRPSSSFPPPPSPTTNNPITNRANTTNMLNSASPQLLPGPQMPTLTVSSRFNNTGQGSILSLSTLNVNNSNNNNNITASFPQVVTNAYANPDGYAVVYHFFRGSQSGVVLNLQPGIYSVADQGGNNTSNNSTSTSLLPNQSSSASSAFTHTYSGDCNNVRSIAGNIVGYGQINMGESKTCIITYSSRSNNAG